MTDNVIISIKGTQVSAEGGPDEMELVTAGVLNQEGEGRYTISYEESELTSGDPAARGEHQLPDGI